MLLRNAYGMRLQKDLRITDEDILYPSE